MSAKTIAVIGGTGNLGAAIAWCLARDGRNVVIGSRRPDAADKKATELKLIRGASNAEAASAAELVILAVPFAAQEATLLDIKPHVNREIVVDTTVPLVPPKVTRVQLAIEGTPRFVPPCCWGRE